MIYYVGGRMNAATAATLRHCAAQLWNPDAADRINVQEIWVCDTAASVANIALARSTARGATPGATVTPDLDNAINRGKVPNSASVLELAAFGTQPTMDASDLFRWNLPAAIGAGVQLPLGRPIEVPPGTGLCVITPTAVVFPICDLTFVFED